MIEPSIDNGCYMKTATLASPGWRPKCQLSQQVKPYHAPDIIGVSYLYLQKGGGSF